MSAPNDANNQEQQQAANNADAPKSFTQDEMDAAITRALKTEREETSKKAKEAALPELEKAKLQVEAAHAELRTLRAKGVLLDAAQAAKANNPAKIHRLYAGELLFSADGEPTNIAALIAQAKKEFPDEFGAGQGSADGGAGSGGNAAAGQNMNDFIRRQAGIRS